MIISRILIDGPGRGLVNHPLSIVNNTIIPIGVLWWTVASVSSLLLLPVETTKFPC